MPNKTFTMLIGAPGTGKSTWAVRQKHSKVFSTDAILEEWGKRDGLSYNQAFARYDFRKVTREMEDRIKKAFAKGQSVIWDQTNMSVKSRAKKLAMVPADYQKAAVIFIVPEAEVKKRLKAREKETGKVINFGVLKSFQNKYERPTEDEFDLIMEIRE